MFVLFLFYRTCATDQSVRITKQASKTHENVSEYRTGYRLRT